MEGANGSEILLNGRFLKHDSRKLLTKEHVEPFSCNFFYTKKTLFKKSKNGKKIKAKCPVCKSQVDKKQIRKITSLFPFEGMLVDPSLGREESFLQAVARFPNFYQWACDSCISNKRAILGKPAKQFYTFKYPWDVAKPYFVYYDKRFKCEKCNEPFEFSKEEQQFWYESLQFVVYSVPKHCKECRQAIKAAKDLNKELSDLLRAGDPDDVDKLCRIAEIYEQMGESEKVKAYLTAARRLDSKQKPKDS